MRASNAHKCVIATAAADGINHAVHYLNGVERHPDGAQGLSKLESISKAQVAADSIADNARRKMMGGDPGPGLDKLKKHSEAKAP